MPARVRLAGVTLLCFVGGAALAAEPAADGGVPAAPAAPAPVAGTVSAEPAAPAPTTPAAPAKPPLVAMLNLETNPAAAELGPSISGLVASTLAASPGVRLITAQDVATAVGLERQKQLLSKDGTCSDSACLAELSGAVGARYVVTGRLDKLGGRFVLTASAFDAAKAVALGKPSLEVESEEKLPGAARELARQVLVALGAEAPSNVSAAALAESKPVGVWLSLKFGNTFVTSLTSLGLGGDIDVGYALTPSWVGFLQIGVTFVRATTEGETGRINVVPTVIGIRHLYRVDKDLQPYWGVGLGVQLAFGQFGFFSDSGPLPNVYAIAGLQWMFSKHVGVLVDASTNLAQAILGLTQTGKGGGFNLDLNVGVAFRF